MLERRVKRNDVIVKKINNKCNIMALNQEWKLHLNMVNIAES